LTFFFLCPFNDCQNGRSGHSQWMLTEVFRFAWNANFRLTNWFPSPRSPLSYKQKYRLNTLASDRKKKRKRKKKEVYRCTNL
jgi:hypothetical protein